MHINLKEVHTILIYNYDISDSFTNYKTLFDNSNENEITLFDESCGKIKAKFSMQGNFFDKLCKKSMKYLNNLESTHPSPLEKTQGCIYFYYYLPENMFNEDVYHNKKLSIYKDFLREYAYITSSNIWQYYEKNISDDILLKIKDLFDLYSNFDEFKKDYKCDCGNKCVYIYNSLIVECYKGINGDFCQEMEKFKEKYNHYRSTNEGCDSVQKSLPSAKTFFIIFFIIIPLVILSIISSIIFIIYKVNK
ncbi:hypothetical protein PVMG_04525 [Plasmodium vivax Mauritania I]|uniref:Variable surface protein n=1 Tax=Plasmodium vivax Mauritania I TaxID=1035515 RepID=A0A0J9T2Q4_PLAVI|nr:hypothetical protein PVMG_04525 [Plasmodium vivax Mauritania I]